MSGFARRPNQSEMKTASFTVRLVVHQFSYSPEEVIINPTRMAGVEVGDILEVYGIESSTLTGEKRFRMFTRSETMFLSVKQQTLVSSAGSMEISILNTLADAFSFSARQTVLARVAEKDTAELNAIELSFRNQYIGRADMWRVKDFLTSECVYAGKGLDVEGMRIKIDKMAFGAAKVLSGCVTDQTTLTFRSLTARIFVLIHLSAEMWDFAEDGELYFEKVVGFLKVLFAEWQRLQVSHVVSIIFFSRTHFEKCADECCQWDENPEDVPEAPMLHPNNVLQLNKSTGYLYQDHYKVVVELDLNGYKQQQYDRLLVHVKTQFQQYEAQMGWGSHTASGLRGYPATASEGNVLEAVNMTLSIYEKHYIDRALTRTGQNMLMISAGTGFYHVDRSLSRLTKDRMVDAGVACDLICVTRAPLHHVPLFRPRQAAKEHSTTSQYEIPEWLSIVFYDYQDYFERPFGVPSSVPMQQSRENITFLASRGIYNSFATLHLPPSAVPIYKLGPVLPNDLETYDRTIFSADSLSMRAHSAERPKRTALLDAFSPLPQILVDSDQRSLNAKVLEHWRQRRQAGPPCAWPELPWVDGSNLGLEAGRSSTLERVTTQGNTCYVCIEWVDMQVEPAVQKPEPQPFSNPDRRRSSGALLPLTRSASEKDMSFGSGGERGSQILLSSTSSQTLNPSLAAALLSNLRNMLKAVDDDTGVFSPFDPSTIPSVEALNRDRWGNLYGYKLDIRRLSFDAKPAKLSEFASANWKSFCKPAILPLTSSKWCTPPELSKDYVEYVYVLYVDSGPDGMGLENVLSELICQRLAGDYQQALPPKQHVKEASILMKKQLKESKKDKPSRQQTYYFSSHNQFHQIVVDQLQGFIRVTRCVHKRSLNRFLVKIPYRSFLWSPSLKCFHLTDRDMEAAPDSFDWNKMDNLLAGGDDDEFSDETMLRSKRIRYALIPPCGPQLTGPFRPPLAVVIACESPTEQGVSPLKSDASIPPPDEVTEKLRQARVEAMSTFAQGLCNKTLQQLRVELSGQPNAVVSAEPQRPRRAPTEQKKNADVKSRLDQGFTIRGNRCQNVDVKLKKTTTKFGVRQEWLRIQFDAMYDPERVFQLQIQWLVASGLHVEEWILKNFFRKGKALKDLGIQIVTIPANQSMRSADAYHTALEISMPLQLHRDIARHYLLSYCGFVLEVCQDTTRQQYMHCTGCSIVRESSSGFVWVDNNLMQMSQDPSSGLHIFAKFNRLCARIMHVGTIVDSIVTRVTS